MKHLALALLASSLLLCACARQDVPAGKWKMETGSWTAQVKDIDYGARIATLTDQAGNEIILKVRDEVQNLENVRKGDAVQVDTREVFAVYVRRGGGEPYLQALDDTEFGLKDGLPTKTVVTSTEAAGLVTGINAEDRQLTLRTADGESKTITVPEPVKGFNKVRVGDEIVTRYTRNVIYNIRKAS